MNIYIIKKNSNLFIRKEKQYDNIVIIITLSNGGSATTILFPNVIFIYEKEKTI